MKTAPASPLTQSRNKHRICGDSSSLSTQVREYGVHFVAFIFLTVWAAVLVGCGSGGYAGGGIVTLSRSAVTIDAGQSIPLSATVSAGLNVNWTLTGPVCSGVGCGAISNASGPSVTYTAPAGLTAPIKAILTASVLGTSNSSVISITVNPDPTISGTPPPGSLGLAYSSTLVAAGGTGALAWSAVSGALPDGLALNFTTGVISGTPTKLGTFSETVQIIDSSDVPYKVTAVETITVTTPPVPLTVIGGNPPAGVVGTPYTAQLTATGGTLPYSWSLSSGSLPTGLSLSSTSGAISGTPTTVGVFVFTAQVQDAVGSRASAVFSIAITAAQVPLTLTTSTLPGGTVGVPYNATIGVIGGTSPYACVFTAGVLPAGLSLSGCTVSGTPTIAGTSALTVKATDSGSPAQTTSGPESITISPAPLTLATSTLPNGTLGVPYSATIVVTGGTSPYGCIFTAGTLPAGLSLTGCVVSGTPTVAGTSALTVKATDSSNPVLTTSGPESITINPVTPLALTVSTLPSGTVGVAYNSTIGVTGGTAPYTCIFTAGTLPAGLTLTGAGCIVSGIPTTAGASSLTVKVTDSSNPAVSTSGPISITIVAAPVLVIASPPGATVGVPYTGTIPVTGGKGPYTCSLTAGTLPSGLTLNGCVVSGTPITAGSTTVTVKATDSSTPVATMTGPVTLVVAPAPLALTTTTLPGGTVGVPYSATIGVTGGTSPYTCVFTAGTLPAGLTLTGCTVSGTPTIAGTSGLTVKATDSSTPAQTTSGPESITIAPAPLALTTTTLPGGTVGVPYSATIGVTGGTSPYTCVFTSGTLPAGLTLTGCTVSGTPTIAGTSGLTVKATDSSTPAQTTSGPESITIAPAPVLTVSSPPPATVGTPYTGTIPVMGGTAPYNCTITSGTLPAGLTLTGCVVSGTPTTAASTTVTVKATDSSSPVDTGTGPVTITVNPNSPTLTITGPPPATVGTPYTGPITVTGGTGPYTCAITAGTLPQGLSLSGCVIVGTPTVAGTVTVTVKGTDSSTPPSSTSAPIAVTVNPVATLTLSGTTPNAVVNQPYKQTLTAAGGIAPYAFTVTAGALPAGLTLSTAGVISGTPTTVGASSFTATVTDTESTPQSASLPLVILVTYPTTATDAEFKGPYAFLFQGYDDVVAGVLAYKTATVGSFTADGTGAVSAGELDANHQSSTATGTTVSSNLFLGTYTLGTDNRGMLTITTLNANGTTARNYTYAISVKAPVAPSTISVQGSMIEYDNNQLVGTKGSGSILAQTTAAFSAGLTGSYAFGVQGDTPCQPSCTIGISAGPAAAVGQFIANGAGSISGGTGDSNIATTNYASETLSGSYGTSDSNGRIQLGLTTAGTPAGIYPTDYAVYLVNANQAFVMSTDKHSAYILLAGSTQLQTQASFSNASMNGPFIGYENFATNPGLVSATLQNVLNFSTATIFRATGTGDGNCNVTNVDVGGATSLVSTLTGLGGSLTGLNSLLGTFSATGATTCAVASSGRGILQYPQQVVLGLPVGTQPAPRVIYLASPNFGYFLETSYAGLGNIEPQTGAPFSLATFNGTYVYGTTTASSLASIDSSGYITANGAGTAVSTVDENIGVGTINVLELGVTHTSTYVYSPANTSTGRFVLDTTTVIYAISPNRFVLVDTNPLTTSPSVTVLY